MARKQLTDLDKLDCTEYMLDLLGSKLMLSDFELAAEHWIERCKAECVMRRAQYLVVDPSWTQLLTGEDDE